MMCNSQEDCHNGVDEHGCMLIAKSTQPHTPPLVVHFDGKGSFRTRELRDRTSPGVVACPDTHFPCVGDGYCLPVFVLCDGVNDCPAKEDEAECDSSTTCVGFYRCRASLVCLHPQHVCDGVPQCPQRDDELLCRLHCPDVCTCHGLAFVCRRQFNVQEHRDLRYLDVRGTGMSPQELQDHDMLIYLSLAKCGLKETGNLSFPNLHSLDLSTNSLVSAAFHSLGNLRNLHHLTLSENPMTSIFSDSLVSNCSLRHMIVLDLSGISINSLDVNSLNRFSTLAEAVSER